MESKDNNSSSNVEESDMGNEVSHSQGVKQSVGGEGHIGQFHKVFVEPEVSQTSDVSATDDLSSENIHSQATLKIRGSTSEKSVIETDSVQERPNTQEEEEEVKLIEKCKALITEAADRAGERQSPARPSCSEQVTDLDEIIRDDDEDNVFIAEQVNRGEGKTEESVGTSETLDLVEPTYTDIDSFSCKDDNKSNDNSVVKTKKSNKTISPTKNKDYALKCGIVSETALNGNINSENKVKEKQKSPKAKKQHSKASSSQSIHEKSTINGEKASGVVKNSPKRNPLTKMFKFSRSRKPKSDTEVTCDTNDKIVEGIKEDKNPDQSPNLNNVTDGDESAKRESNGNSTVENSVIKRLNSLDSGIVVDKVTDQQNIGGVEYAIVQKKKSKGLVQVKTGDSPKKPEIEKEIPSEESKSNTEKPTSEDNEALYINGNRDDKDFVYINERAVDVSGLVEPVTNTILQTPSKTTEEAGGSDKTSERVGNEAEVQSIVSSDSVASSGAKYKISDKPKLDKAKLKKKSWSFQVMGKKEKKGSDSVDAETASKISMDPNASPSETKKSKWLFGKFSFRRSSDDMTSSTPNLQQVGIPEEEGVDIKPKSKSKKKGKEKKKKSPKKDANTLDRRSESLMDIVLRGDANAPRSRRSIIEDDLEYTPTDAFEGVTLSDLSQDEEAEGEVTLDPSGNAKPNKERNHKSDKKGNAKALAEEANAKLKNIAKTKPVVDVNTEKVPAADSNQVEDEYVNVVDVEKSTESSIEAEYKLTAEITEDQHVNTETDNAQTLQNVRQNQTERIEVGGDEYAVVVKKQNVTETVNVKESAEVNAFIDDDTLMKEYGLDSPQISDAKNEDAQEDIVVPVSSEKAFSNMIYSDEEFNATLSKIADKTNECNDAIEGKTKGENGINCEINKEIDEYVQLKEIVTDETETESGKERTESTSNEEKTMSEKVETEKVETEADKEENNENGTEIVPEETIVSETMIKVENKPHEAEAEIERIVKTQVRTVVMKDIGVQAPDIYMPLDIDADFGNVPGKVPSVSIGIQVDSKELDDVSHVVVTMDTKTEEILPSEV